MQNALRAMLLFTLTVTFFGILFSFNCTRQNDYQNHISIVQLDVQTNANKARQGVFAPKRNISLISASKSRQTLSPANSSLNNTKDCNCKSEESGKSYNFCYTDPQNSTSIGRKFDCAHLKTLKILHLVENSGPFVDLSNSEENAKNIVFISAVSENHFNEANNLISTFYKFNPDEKLILYSMGLRDLFIKNLKISYKKLEIRIFNTTAYPEYVNHWMEYRFKPLILAEVMKEYSNIWWMDAHISVKMPNMVSNLFNNISAKLNETNTKLARHSVQVEVEQVDSLQKVPIYFFIHSSHSNFAVMIPELLNYFPTNSISLLKNPDKGSQMGANTFFVARTELSVEIFKWWVLCALDETCMNPQGAQVSCSFGDDRNNVFVNCFRFDQSVINLLMLNLFQDHNQYFLVNPF